MDKIPKYPNYGINKNGEIFNLTRNKILKASPQSGGYLTVRLSKNGKASTKSVHQLVLETFVGVRPKGHFACHNNGVKTDNRLLNLRYDTPKNNSADRKKHGTNFGPRGIKAHSAKLNQQKVKLIRLLRNLFQWKQHKIAKIFNVDQSTICDILNFKIWI